MNHHAWHWYIIFNLMKVQEMVQVSMGFYYLINLRKYKVISTT